MSLTRTDTTIFDTQTADIFSPRSSLFLIRGPHSAAHILLAHPKRPSYLTWPTVSNPPTRATLRGPMCYVVPPTYSWTVSE
jgi:hypothetical protein